MLCEKIFKSRILALGVLWAFLLLLYPVKALTQASSATGSLTGYIFDEDLETPLENAVVQIRNIENEKEYKSTLTDESGSYEIKDIEEGRYILGVSTEKGDFNFDYSILIKANEKTELSLAVKPGVKSAQEEEKEKEKEKKKKKGILAFFTSTAGILILIASAAVLTIGFITILPGAPPASPAKKKK